MNEKNTDYLKKQIFYLGFGNKLDVDLQNNIKAQKDQFQLPILAEFSKGDKIDIVSFKLDFTKSKEENSDMYFLNSYKATLKHDDPGKEKSQTFYINKGSGVTAKEAYNLLEGRAVHKKLTNKENVPYEAWIQLNPKIEENGNHKVQQYHSAYGFDLQKNLDKHPIKELTNPEQKERLINSLEKGNLQQVTYTRNDKEEKMYVEANPKDRNVIFYDVQMVKQFQGIKEKKGEASEMTKSQDSNASEKNRSEKKEVNEEPDAKRSKGRKMSV
jgi:hypothetical protein